MDENENDIIEITDENGKNIPAELLKVIEYKDVDYAILHPLEEGNGIDTDSCYIFEMQEADEDSIDLIPVQDDEILDAVYDMYVEWAEQD